MRKIYVVLALIMILTVFSFANGWLNAQSEIQNSFNANSPSQNLQNQLLGSTNTNGSFLNLGSNVSVSGSNNLHDKGTYVLLVNISNYGTTKISVNNFPGNSKNWIYWTESTTTDWHNNGIVFSVSYENNNYLNFHIYIPSTSTISPGTYNGLIKIYGQNPGNDQNLWVESINLTLVYKTQSYIATATSYDASFCGVTGNVLTNAYNPNGVLLAKLTVQSNMSTITVNVSTGVNGGSLTPGISPLSLPNGMTLNYSSNYNYNKSVLTLPTQTGSQYSGELDIYASNKIAPWTTPGQTTIQFQFTIIPKGSY